MSLTELACKNAKPREKSYKLTDGDGMYLEVLPAGGKYWRMKYRYLSKEKRLSGRIPPFFSVIEEAHTFIPSAKEGTQDAVSLPIIRRIITEGRKFGTGLMLISQRPSRLDETIVSQCNSFLILRLVNPNDQRFVKSIMENLTDADARLIPGFGPGQGIVSGQVVRFPLPVQVKMDNDLLASVIGDEDFFDQVEAWVPDTNTKSRNDMKERMERVRALRKPKKQK